VGKNVAVFVDVANIFYAAKAAGVDIDYVTLLKSATAGRDFVRAYAYTGLDPDNENQRNFHAFLARNSYKVVSKDIRKYGDGKVKANLDIELVVDLMKTARNLDVAIVVSGDGDFAPAIRAVQEMGVRVEVISFRGNTSSDLIEVADLFTDITQLARVEKGSSRSGRRVAGDEEDLSMTEVPDKQTEGTGAGRGRGRGGRGRGRAGEAEPVAARGRSRVAAVAASDNGAAALTVLPGEKLSKAASDVTQPVEDAELEPEETGEPVEAGEPGGEEARRRRRRRGGRGRGRGRGREQEAVAGPGAAAADEEPLEDEEEEEALDIAPPRGRRPTPFGSVWDSQLGVPSTAPAGISAGGLGEDEDFDEPEIPEYLIAEQRRGQAGRGPRGGQGGRGARGGRSAYSAAIDRERYGRGGGGGINRYPDVSGRDRGGAGRGRPQEPAFGRGERHDRAERPASRSNEPWSEVPEDLQAMLRAQLAQSPKAAAPRAAEAPAAEEAAASAPRRRTTRTTRAPAGEAAAPADAGAGDAVAQTAGPAEAGAGEAIAAETTAPKRRTTRRKAADTEASTGPGEAEAAPEAAAPKRRATRATASTRTTAATRTTRTKAGSASTAPDGADGEGATAGGEGATAGEAAAPKRRTTRRKTPATEANEAS
jgi:uncharacterized LabA/DUF88 family protein